MDKKKKVIIAAEIFPPDIGGPATYSVKLAEDLVKKNYEVVVLTYADISKKSRRIKNQENSKGYKLVTISRNLPTILRYYVYGFKLILIATGADVIYAQGPLSAGLPASMVKRITRARFVVKVVGDQAWERAIQFGQTNKLLDEFQNKNLKGKIGGIRKIQNNVLRSADSIITVSNWFKGIIKQWGIPGGRVKVIHNSVDIGYGLERVSQGLKPVDEDIILTVGRMTKWKGIQALIEIIPELLERNPKFKLVVVGEGPELENLRSIVCSLKLTDKVEFTGKLSEEDVTIYYSKAKIFVLNSGYENWSHVLVEAMFHKIPVIASQVGGNPELVKNEQTGLLVEYNNKESLKCAIIKLWSNHGLTQKLVNNAYRQVSSYKFSDMVDLTLSVLFESRN